MKILVISAQPPSPYSGGEIRLMNIINHLSSQHQFTVIAPIRNPDTYTAYNPLNNYRLVPVPLFGEIEQKSRIFYILNAWKNALFNSKPQLARSFYNKKIQNAVYQALSLDTFDIIQAQQLLTAQYLPRQFLGRSGENKKKTTASVLDVDNLWTKLIPREQALLKERRSNRITHRIQNYLDEPKVVDYENYWLNNFDGCLAISPEEEIFIQEKAPKTETTVVPNGVDIQGFRQNASESETPDQILFTGTMSWGPNIDAMEYFCHHILPIVTQKHPNAKIQIVGRDPTPAVFALSEPGLHNNRSIEITGFVQDVRPYLSKCQVFVAPLRAGAGTRLKILEAFAMGKAVVATPLAAEGLAVKDGHNIFLASEPQLFADRISALFQNQTLRRDLGKNGRVLVEKMYDWHTITQNLDGFYQKIRVNDEDHRS